MPDTNVCPECGAPSPVGLPQGLCSRCALKGALELSSEENPSQKCRGCGTGIKSDAPFSHCPKCLIELGFGPLPEVDPAVPIPNPRRFGDYELFEEIGRGGMGVVWRARQMSLDRIVAVKAIVGGEFAAKEIVRRFRTEASAAAFLQHPNIVAVHDVGVQDGQHFFSMDYVEGQNLTQLVGRRPLPPAKAARYAKIIAEAIHYAHERGILHRDLKPSNVLIDQEDNPRVTDFGLAKRVQNGSFITSAGQVLGSPNFMPPEQAGGEGKAGRYSDVYGLGAVLYFLLAARAPFHGETLEATLHQVLNTEPVSPRLLNPAVPPDLETICLKCLAKEPSRRYATAQQLVEELSHFLKDEPISARPVSAVEKLERWCHRKPQLAAAIGAACFLFLLGFTISVWQWRRAEKEAEAAQLNLYVADMRVAHQAVVQNNHRYAIEKLNAHIPKSTATRDLRGWEWRYLWRLCAPNELFSLPASERISAVAVSPDGAFLAAGRQDGVVIIWDLIRRRALTNFVGSGITPGQTAIAFSADGGLFAMIKQDRALIYLVPAWVLARELISAKPASLFALAFEPGTTNLLASTSSGFRRWDALGGNEVPSPVRTNGYCRHVGLSSDGRWMAANITNFGVVAWQLPAGTRVFARAMGPQNVSALAVSPSGLLAVGDREGEMRVWRLSALAPGVEVPEPATWNTRSSTLYAAAFSPDESTLATGGSDHTIHLWSTTNWSKLALLQGHTNEVWSLAFAHDGSQLFSGGKDGAIRAWNPRQRPLSDTLVGARFPLRFSSDSRFLVTLNEKRDVEFWDVVTRTHHDVFRPATNINPQFLEMSPDGRRLVVKAPGNIIHVLDAKTGKSHGTLNIDRTNLTSATPWLCSPDSRFVAVCTRRLHSSKQHFATALFKVESREEVMQFEDLRSPLRFSYDGRFLAGRNSADKPVVWDLKSGRRLHVFDGLRGLVTSLDFSRDNQILAVASNDSEIGLWHLSTGRMISTLIGHQQGVGRILFSHDNRTLFSTSTDDTVKLWNVATRQEMLSLTDYGADTFHLALSPDDTTLAVGTLGFGQQPVKIWQAPALKEIDAERTAAK